MESERVQETQREMFSLGSVRANAVSNFHLLKSFRLGVCVLVPLPLQESSHSQSVAMPGTTAHFAR